MKGNVSFGGEIVAEFTTSKKGKLSAGWTLPDGARSGTVTVKTSSRQASATLQVQSTPPPPPTAQCSDGTDNDGDGKTDHPDDPGCESHDDDSESPDPSPPPPPPPDGAQRWSDPATWAPTATVCTWTTASEWMARTYSPGKTVDYEEIKVEPAP